VNDRSSDPAFSIPGLQENAMLFCPFLLPLKGWAILESAQPLLETLYSSNHGPELGREDLDAPQQKRKSRNEILVEHTRTARTTHMASQ
jgi:hypothetical protein